MEISEDFSRSSMRQIYLGSSILIHASKQNRDKPLHLISVFSLSEKSLIKWKDLS